MSPRTAHQNQEVRAVTRARLLNAALELFAAKGYSAASVDAIAETAGVSAGLLYHHFDGKAAVLNAIFEQSLADVQATFAAADRESEARDRLPRYCARRSPSSRAIASSGRCGTACGCSRTCSRRSGRR